MTWHVSPWSRVIALAFRKRSNRNMLIHPARGQADSAVVREGRRLTVGWSYVRRGEGRARDRRAVRLAIGETVILLTLPRHVY